jgi:CBS domain-containing protein
MTTHVITTTEDTALADIAELMIKTRISGLPVLTKHNKMAGVVTAEDLFVIMDMIKSGDIVENGTIAVSNPTVKFAMSTEAIKITDQTTLDEIIAVMKYKNVHTLPVFKKNKMVGVIGRRDVFRNFYAVVKDLYE